MYRLDIYTKEYLEFSWKWLNDPEIKALTDTPDFTKEGQKKWFDSLASKSNYKIWGVSYEGIPIGVFGIKNIDKHLKSGEYWGYIGEKNYWGKGLGKKILIDLLTIARNELYLDVLCLKVLISNVVALALYKKVGFIESDRDEQFIYMFKKL